MKRIQRKSNRLFQKIFSAVILYIIFFSFQSVFIREIPEEGQQAAEENFTWWIPLIIVAQNNLDFVNLKPSIWMKEEKRIILNHLPPSTYFIIVNPEEIGESFKKSGSNRQM